jgi:glycosyltransferase involved in cell wall biosynthesis
MESPSKRSFHQDAPPPRFSVVVPTCDRNHELNECLKRLAPGAQDLEVKYYEVIVSDDGKTHSAKEMISSVYSWAHWVPGPRRGPAANRNNGAEHANGEFIIFTDDDCRPGSGWLSAFKRAISPGIRVCEGRTVTGNEKMGAFETAPINEGGGKLWSCNMMVEADLFRRMRGFDERFPFPHLEDVDFRRRLEIQGIGFPFVSDAIVVHPPRPIHFTLKSVWGEAKGQESYFYYSSKHRVSLSESGFGVRQYLRHHIARLRRSRSISEAAEYSARTALLFLLLLPRIPGWMLKYHSASKT